MRPGETEPRAESKTGTRGPDLVSIAGLILGAAGLLATGVIGWYWLGFAISLSFAVWQFLLHWQESRHHPSPAPTPLARALHGLHKPGFALSLVALVVFSGFLIWPRPDDSGAVVAPRPGAGVELYKDALGDNFKVWALDIQQLQTGKGPGNEAPLLGGWWSLADWCVLHKRGTPGVCYDLAAEYVQFWFQRDPRTINAENWLGAGAIGGLVVDGYNSSQKNLRLDPSHDYIPDLFAGRPGIALLCEPSCTARM